MINWKYPPKSSLVAQHVECYWCIEKKPHDDGHPFPKLTPDPTAHLIIAPAEQGYLYQSDSASFEGQGSHWLFPHCQTFEIDHTDAFIILGVKFHTGALYSLDMTPHQAVLEQVVKLDVTAFFDSAHQEHGDNCNQVPDLERQDISRTLLQLAQTSPENCCDTLEAVLQPWLHQASSDKHSLLTRKALPLLPNTLISQLGTLLHCSQRTLERSFTRVTGLTLKQCQSMNRLDLLLESLYLLGETDIDWAEVAQEFGFSDQPHLIRYLKNTIGKTPGEYAKVRDLTIDIYGGVEYS
ncbi:helix-turn-helix domain-containing protein [Photobacterium sanguinicancri]|uniref:helix-turn-helix domain-containing protein n=1 Tax=Photobacterium sanguinicancri TaxID=875932 RepID=UPI000787277B|nr:helix-turn-helix domain-containing protein [Photobacterium sanguinicancri]KXI21165.1 AraC family transcriptional regulator [Photobacterium sanguinicancri]